MKSGKSVERLKVSTELAKKTFQFRLDRTAYGQPTILDAGNRVVSDSQIGNTRLFAAREYEFKLGIYGNRTRYYDPSRGAFIQEDPIGVAGDGVNYYAYASENPLLWTDPLGLAKGDWWDPKTYWFDDQGARRIANDIVLNEMPLKFPNPREAHNNIADAWRHARWNQRMVNELGVRTAIYAGYGHELEGLWKQWRAGEHLRWDEMFMDLHNNRVGRTQDPLLWPLQLKTLKPKCPNKGGTY